jgi:hypothetical protein
MRCHLLNKTNSNKYNFGKQNPASFMGGCLPLSLTIIYSKIVHQVNLQ